jgi:hypothetical protein
MTGADLGYQATTRGGRPIDAMLGGKASFKEGAQSVATVATAIGAAGFQSGMMGGGRGADNVGMLGMFVGLAAQAASQSAQAQADIREWEQLPGTVWLGAGDRKAAAPKLAVSLEGGSTSSVVASRLVDTPTCQLYWGRSIAPLSLQSEAGPMEPGEHQRDPAFRQELATFFQK